MSPLQKGGLKLTDFSFAAYESYPFIESSHILRIFGKRRFKGNVLNEPRHKPRNPLGSVSDMIERNGLPSFSKWASKRRFRSNTESP
jgi:hypothetical protein